MTTAHRTRACVRWAACAALTSAIVIAPARGAHAQDMSSVVAKAREQMDGGNYQEGIRTLSTLKGKSLPPQLAIEVALLETTAALVNQSADAASEACGRAVIAANYDPEVARELSPKVREACKAAAKKVRGERLAAAKVNPEQLVVEQPSVAYQAVRLSSKVAEMPSWLRVIARIESSSLEGSFDVPLVPSDEGALLGTLDSAWIRPSSKLTLRLVAQDRFGDLSDALDTATISVPANEAAISLGEVPTGGVVELDGDRVTPDERGRVAAAPGAHEVRLTLPSGAYAEAEVELERGSVAQVTLAPSEQGPSRVWPWIATGTALALGVAGGVLLINHQLRLADLEEASAEREPGTGLPSREYAELAALDEERLTFLYAGIGTLAGAGAVGVLATVLWLVPTGGSAPAEPPKDAWIAPMLSPAMMGVIGGF